MADQVKDKEVVPEGVDDIDPAGEMSSHAVSQAEPDAPPATADQDEDEGGDKTDVIDTIVPKAEPKVWRLEQINEDGKVEEVREYVQRPLAFLAKMQFFALVGEVIDKSITGEEDKAGLRLSSLFEMPGRGGVLSAADFREADTFIQGVGKILQYAPDFLEKSYCIWLGVPDYEREWAIGVMEQPLDKGGLTDDQGLEIIEIFIDQNWESLEDFFRKKIASLRDRVNSHRPKEEEKKQLAE